MLMEFEVRVANILHLTAVLFNIYTSIKHNILVIQTSHFTLTYIYTIHVVFSSKSEQQIFTFGRFFVLGTANLYTCANKMHL